MHEIHANDPRASADISTLFKSSRLIPFFGSGFTRGVRAKSGRTPDAAQLVKHITSIAASKPGLRDEEKVEILNITQLKSAFGLLSTPDYISPVQARTLLGNLFSKTQLADAVKEKVLNLDWPHIFTFNIDDAIENQTKKYQVLHPNRPVSREYIAANKCLFKIHGDISEFVRYEDPNLIFTWKDYSHSIATNNAMLSFLSNEAQASAFLFIGCSLDAELDLIHLSKLSPFSKSIYLKKGKTTVSDRLALAEYGIERVITFDTYDQIYFWIAETLKNVTRESPFRSLDFDDSPLKKDAAISIIANGGPLSKLNGRDRTAFPSKTFPSRTAIEKAAQELRKNECILVTGRRFSGKTLFLFQLIERLKEYGATFYGSTDAFDPAVKELLRSLENHIFIFDSGNLNATSLDEVLHTSIHNTSKLILCASSGDAELYRFRLEARRVSFHEINLPNVLDKIECDGFNESLAIGGLPLYQSPENLLTFAFRYYGEFGTKLKVSSIFSKQFSDEEMSILLLIAAFGKVEIGQIKSIKKYFNSIQFVKDNDRLLEIEPAMSGGSDVIVCNSTAWLLKTVRDFISKNSSAIDVTADIIESLASSGFASSSRNLISFDKLNELGGGENVHKFIRSVYSKIAQTYHSDTHYWLQRAKSELISARNIKELEDGMGYASKVRLDTEKLKNQTYFSATLVMAQLSARAYKLTGSESYLIDFLNSGLESLRNYANNRRHIEKLIRDEQSEIPYAIKSFRQNPPQIVLTRKKEVDELLSYFSSGG